MRVSPERVSQQSVSRSVNPSAARRGSLKCSEKQKWQAALKTVILLNYGTTESETELKQIQMTAYDSVWVAPLEELWFETTEEKKIK